LKLKYDALLSTFAFKFNLRHYSLNLADNKLTSVPKELGGGGAG